MSREPWTLLRQRCLPYLLGGIARGTILLVSSVGAFGHAAAQDLPPPWTHQPINASKPSTQYTFDVKPDQSAAAPVLHASAHRAASLAAQFTQIDLKLTPWIRWRWQILKQPTQPDITAAAREDAAARLIFFFDGDVSRLPWSDRLVMAAAKRLGSRALPYATLMYVSAPGVAEGAVVANPYTRRIQMLVVDGSFDGNGSAWREFSRDLASDYHRVFGAPPGKLLGWAFMTDSDNTRSQAKALFEPVRWSPTP